MHDGGWARFGISEDERLDHERYVASSSGSLVSGHPNAHTVVDDVRQQMLLALLKFTGGPDVWKELGGKGNPPALPDDPDHRTAYLHKIMYRAGQDCLDRQVYDGPYEGRRRNWERVFSFEEVQS